jgi:hypothetical protein
MHSHSEFASSCAFPRLPDDHARRPHQQQPHAQAHSFSMSLPGFPGHVFAFNTPATPASAPAPAAKSFSDILQDGQSRVCPECKKRWAYPSGMVRHFLKSHRDIAQQWLPHACLGCAVNCLSAEGLAAHERTPGHANVANKKRTAAQAVRLMIFHCFTHCTVRSRQRRSG